ncbi:MAG: hypothetical protein N2235_21755 [Fischerella sp.]|nr:hypothetical protein [Fischerella sp.]
MLRATVELTIAIALFVLAIATPVVAEIIVIGVLTFAIARVWKFFRRKPSFQKSESVST